ncbi:MarR family winged helix-turn-helix transcriptional regulator [Methylovirgula sp. 4M-Z18]|uniref:MarR family winged helix-turn-helix transcriptional regulator n=1 Tax=Methylovirgula sp. 4M-Z18 TaxID=2293567 RepID=UPI000E2EE8AD|nr:MarR family transcriptional regulator [Methylovirgula sp. 4M-Z18]RFB75641.1 MarR family transcriptional regulator [Methylovirgula sp. 4M-Z18]
MSNDLEAIVAGTQEGKKLELRLWLRLLSTTRLISQEIRQRLRNEFNTTLPQFDVLSQLYRQPDGLRLGEISQLTMVTNGNITALVERLEAEGMLVRERLGQDRRVTVARLTPQGREIFGRMARAHENWLKELLADVDPIVLAGLLTHVGQVKSSTAKYMSKSGSSDDD